MSTTTVYIHPMQYRAGNPLESSIQAFAAIWNISNHQAARRLTSLAAYDLDLRFYSVVMRVAKTFNLYHRSRVDFPRACQEVQRLIEQENLVRDLNGQPALKYEEREAFVQKALDVRARAA